MKQKGSPRFARVEAGLAPIVIVLLIAAAIGGYLVYSGKINPPQKQVTCTKEAKICPDGSSVGRVGPKCEFSPCPAPSDETSNWKTYTSTQLPNNRLKPYTIQYSPSWSLKIGREGPSDTFTLEKDGYNIGIYQSAFGGGGCIFEGEMPPGPYDDLRDTKYVQIDSEVGVLRRFTSSSSPEDPNTIKFDFCVSTNGKDFGSPTQVGIVTYKVPKNYSETILVEMDKVISTLKIAE